MSGNFNIPMRRLKKLKLNGKPYKKWPKKLRIASSRFFARNLLKIRGYTKGLLRITPRDSYGEAIKEFADSGLPREHLLLANELRRLQNGEVDDPDATMP